MSSSSSSSSKPTYNSNHEESTNQNDDNNNCGVSDGEEGGSCHRDEVQKNQRLQNIWKEHVQKLIITLQRMHPMEQKKATSNTTACAVPESSLAQEDFDISRTSPPHSPLSIAEEFQKRDLVFEKNTIWEESLHRINLVLEECSLVFQRRHIDYSKATTISEEDISETDRGTTLYAFVH
mmetsp:Transcript_8718/g.12437  ORF Transcript_8718/g.12437 Transcript_8718/m.12437 type:complete len:179 (+) Transcript_8718:457-993(+)